MPVCVWQIVAAVKSQGKKQFRRIVLFFLVTFELLPEMLLCSFSLHVHSQQSVFVCVYSAGAGRTGTFCALSTVLERVKAEGILDVFQTVKSLRLQRPHMVQTLVSGPLIVHYF